MKVDRQQAVESRQQITKSNLNSSTSKQLWSFSKKRRFQKIKTQCPHAFYDIKLSTLVKKQPIFTTSGRKVFTEISQAPLPGTYSPAIKIVTSALFSESRQNCINNSYVPQNLAANPSPSQYNTNVYSQSKKGYTMRPKTANQRNYFIEDKERQGTPSPFTYDVVIEKNGVSRVSNFRTTVKGGVGLMNKQQRFQNQGAKTPSVWNYSPNNKYLRNNSTGAKIGTTLRQSFIDSIRKSQKKPGPGDYELPSEFGHYKARSLGKQNRFVD